MSWMWQEIYEQSETLGKSYNSNKKAIQEIASVIKARDIRFVYIAARGTSDHAAVYGKYIIEYLLGVPVVLAAPSIATMYHKTLNLSNSLVIGISQSGEALDVLEMITKAKEQNAITISMTNFATSPLAAASDFHLYLNTGLERSVAATKTFTAQIYLMAWLIAEWAQNGPLKKELVQIPQQTDELFKGEQEITACAESYKTIENCFVLTRGINYSIALEAALKIQETSNIHAIAHATSDFYHGPIAMIGEFVPVILFAPDGPCYEDVAAMGRKLKEKNASVITVSNRPAVSSFSDTVLSIPHTVNDVVSPFFNVMVAQMFACQLALNKGLNPDLPKGLNKVTITK